MPLLFNGNGITAQDTFEYHDVVATDPVMMTEQAKSILEDMLASVS